MCPAAIRDSTTAGPRNTVPPRTKTRLGATLANAERSMKEEHAEAALTTSELLIKLLRSIPLLPELSCDYFAKRHYTAKFCAPARTIQNHTRREPPGGPRTAAPASE